jgi:hypothetical protein
VSLIEVTAPPMLGTHLGEKTMLKRPDHSRQLDFFVAYLTDLPMRDQRDTMERPFFSLSNSSVVNLLVILQAGNALLMNSIGHSRLVVEALSG